MTPDRPTIVVVGLGPGDPDLVTAGTLAAIEATPVRFLRTERHPSAGLVVGATTFDHHYDDADTFDQVYRRIVADLVAAASEHGRVLYAVPGSPRVLERTVDLLVAEGERGTMVVEVLPALSFVDLAWVRLGIDPFEDGVRLVDGHRFAVAAAGERGPLLVAHCHNRRVLSDIKLAVEEPPTEPVVVLQRLGLPDEAVSTVAWADLDRDVEPDHLTALYVPQLAAPVAGEVQAFVELVATLRAECPWDAEQTHATLARHLVEETYEVLDALDAVGEGGPDTDPDAYADLEEELGDLLFQIVFHTTLATEAGAFGLAEVARGVHDKLRFRHPHVFPREGVLGDATVDGAEDVAANWEQIKQEEKGRASVFDGIPSGLPALAYAAKVQKKAESLGVTPAGPTPTADLTEDELGDLLLAIVTRARAADLDAESVLRRAANALRDHARTLEP
ncbi:MAG: nucleotide pyrophosphohydrolase [Actinobacteria bacterium]|nr:nucleotide pyrophosphohydrolase [Actinomycetota bacterium]